MLVAMLASGVLVVLTIVVHYEILRLTSIHLRDLPVPVRARIVVVVLAAFIAHTVEVWLYGVAYWLLAFQFSFGGFGGETINGFLDCLYFSIVTYTTIGYGDSFPLEHIRLIAGVEALNGLLLIGWSASFTYLAMEEYWPMHSDAAPVRRRRKDA